MAFNAANLARWSPLNQTGPHSYGYYTKTDTVATVNSGTYFTPFGDSYSQSLLPSPFSVGDTIACTCSNGNINLTITSITPIATTEETQSIIVGPNSVNTAAIQANAVTAAKIANATITTTQISASAGILGSQLAASAGILGSQLSASAAIAGSQLSSSAGITGSQLANNTVTASQIANNTITSAQLALNTIQFATVTGITPNTLYSAGTQLVGAPGAGLVIIPLTFAFNYIFATAQYTSGGAIGVQYNSTVHQGGQLCSATLAAATFNAYAANEMFGLAVSLAGVSSGSINQPLYLTAASNNFATGAGTISAFVSYIVVSAS